MCFSGWMGLGLGVWKQGPRTVLVFRWMGLAVWVMVYIRLCQRFVCLLVAWLELFNAELSPKRYWRGPPSSQ